MDRLIPALYSSFGRYKNTQQMFPRMDDGLLPVHRRFLLGLHTFAKNGYKKTAEVVGGVIGNWHPHAASEGPLEYLVQNGFADGYGSWGSRIGTERLHCAAMRYTNIKASDEIEQIAFKYIQYVEWKELELKEEPISLPTMLPFCLMARDEMQMMGFGFKTEIPTYDKSDLIKRLLSILNNDKTKPIIKPVIYQCDVVNGDFEDILTKGQGKIDVVGKHTIDSINKRVIVNGWSPRNGFDVMLNRIDKYNKWNLLTNSDIGWIDSSNDNNGTNVKFEVVKQRNTDSIFKKMKEAIIERLKASHTYNIYVVDDDKVRLVGVDDMLLAAYNNFKNAYNTYLHKSIEKNNALINELMIIEAIRPHISKLTNDTKLTVDDIIKELSKITKFEEKEIREVISKHTIRKLMTVNTDITSIKEENIQHQSKIDNLDNVCKEEYQSLS